MIARTYIDIKGIGSLKFNQAAILAYWECFAQMPEYFKDKPNFYSTYACYCIVYAGLVGNAMKERREFTETFESVQDMVDNVMLTVEGQQALKEAGELFGELESYKQSLEKINKNVDELTKKKTLSS